MPEIRKNLITGEYVIMAPERAKRPEDFVPAPKQTNVPSHVPNCPFCPGNEDKTPPHNYRFPETGQWAHRCIPNKFSALNSTGELWKKEDGLKLTMAGVGLHEVIIETARHDQCIALQPIEDVKSLVMTYQNRLVAFYADPRVEHVILFRNHGASAGTSLEHPHSQIVGIPMTPAQVRARFDDALKFFLMDGDCLVCRTMRAEREEGARVILESKHFLAFIPYAALSPFHTWIFPKRHSAYFGSVPPDELDDLASVLKTVLGKIRKGLDNPDFNFVIRSGAPGEAHLKHLHWYIAIVPRVTKAAGFELGTGMYINPSIPEASAEFLRKVEV